MALTTTYSVPLAATVRLDALVARITANPGNMLQPAEIARYSEGLSVRPAFDHLPEGMADSDFIGILKLALLTECATDTYAEAIDTRARSYDAPWLGNFIKDVWVPDEMSHHTPYRTMLISAGFTEAELDTEIRQTIDRVLDYNSGDTPIHLTTYGMIQEYLTDNWHGLIGRLLKQSVPNAARLANRVKQRETLHTLWYRDMTILQLEANPRLLTHVAEAVGNFEMPGKSLVPELEPDVPRWLPLLGNDFDRWARDLVRMLYQIAGDTRRAGQLLIEVAAERGTRIGPLSPTVVRAVMDRLGGPGYGLLGEAMLERVGLGYLYRDKPSYGWRPPLASRLRGMLREWVAGQIELKVTPDAMPAHSA